VDMSRGLLSAMWILLGIQIVAVSGFVLVQRGGVFGWLVRLLQRLRLARPGSRVEDLVSVDRSLAVSYRERRGRVLACVLLHLLGWIVGSLEVYLVLWWLHVPASLVDALVIDAFGLGVKFLGFAVP